MNIETANRLVELRHKMGLSQEELAQRLGISRQAVSKWEQAESSPDTDNLIMLAQLYGITIDELLNGRSAVSPTKAGNTPKEAEPKEQIDSAVTSDTAKLKGSSFVYVDNAPYAMPAVCNFKAELQSAYVTVKAADVDAPQVELSGSERLKEACTILREGDTLFLKQLKRNRAFGLHLNEKLHVEALLPRRMRFIGVDIGGGSISADGVLASTLLLHTGGGGLELNNCSAESISLVTGGGGNGLKAVRARSLVCTTGGGGNELEDVKAETAEIKTGGGGVDLNDIEAIKLTAKTGGGSIDAAAIAAAEAELATGGGHIKVRDGSIGSLGMRSGGGSLTAELSELGSASCTAGGGSISVSSRVCSGAEVNLNALSGRSTLIFNGAETARGRAIQTIVGDGSAKLNMKTASGSITVRLGELA
mgnify:CR=1 FL=1